MKKVLVMGGGVNQIPLIQAAKKMNYIVVLCDANDKVPGKAISDIFYHIDISKKELLTDVAKKENVDGAVCNTESLMGVLAAVQTDMGFVGNTEEAVAKINDKYLFRNVQREASVFSPKIERFCNYDDALKYVESTNIKLFMKPEMCSGSRGVYTINNQNRLTEDIFTRCVSYSRNNYVLIEDFVDFSDKPALEAEVFLLNGKIELMCLFRTIRDKKRNILPQCYCSDNELDSETELKIQNSLQAIFSKAGIQWGEYNVELSFNSDDEIFVIEINARQGGMMLPDFVNIYTGIDINKLLVSTAVSDFDYITLIKKVKTKINKNCIHFRVITDKSGIYKGYSISDELNDYIVKKFSYTNIGSCVISENGNYTSVALLDFSFPNKEIRKCFEKNLQNCISVLLEKQ